MLAASERFSYLRCKSKAQPRNSTPSPDKARRRASQSRGVCAEADAAALLQADGYEILSRRYRTPAGEIDIVAKRDGALRFVEVKSRRSLAEAAWSITERQQRRIAQAAEYWLQAHEFGTAQSITLDAVFVTPGAPPEHIVDAFRVS